MSVRIRATPRSSRAVIWLAQSLGLRTVAEGVESDAQCMTLRALGCDMAQGYYFSKAKPHADFVALLEVSPTRCRRTSPAWGPSALCALGAGTQHEGVTAARLDLYWIPLGAGARVVQCSGRLYESICARRQRRNRCDLYHSALIATTAAGAYTIEMTPTPDERGRAERGVVAEGVVGSRLLRSMRVFRYEIRCWRDGVVPDLGYAVGSPVTISEDEDVVKAVLDLVPEVPTLVWGRDEVHAGEMWNSNSVVSWVLDLAGVSDAAGRPPAGGRAPGWDAGLLAARGTTVPARR